MEKLKVLSLFSGIGAFEKALTNQGIEFELVGFSEIDKYAIKSYCAIHDVHESLNFGDVSKIQKKQLPEFDLLVGGSPCQAFSVAGHRKGFEDTRGTLFFQYVETLKHKQPKYFVYENVKGLINHDKGNTLDTIAQSFSEVGYRIDLELINSKYFNVPQNRERIYIIGIREDLIENEEWKIDSSRNDVLAKGKRRLKELGIKSFNFNYPKQELVNLRLRDILETNVDEKYYLSEEKTAKLIAQLENKDIQNGEINIVTHDEKAGQKGFVYNIDGISSTLMGTDYKDPKRVLEPQMLGLLDMKGQENIRRVYSADGVSPTLTTMGGGHREPKIVEPQVLRPERTEYGKLIRKEYESGLIEESRHNMTSLQPRNDGISNTLTSVQKDNWLIEPKISVELVGNVNPSGNGMNGAVYNSEGLSPTITTNKGEGLKVAVEYSRKDGIGKEVDIAHTLSASDWRGLNPNQKQNAVLEEVRPVLTPDREEKRQQGRRFKENDEPAFTVNTIDKHGVAIGNYPKYRIRKLTPLECFRLQAFSDEDYQKCVEVGISNSQLYKQSGNSITVTVLESIFKELLLGNKHIKL